MVANFILFLILNNIIRNIRRTQFSNLKGGGCRKLTDVIKAGYADRPRVALCSFEAHELYRFYFMLQPSSINVFLKHLAVKPLGGKTCK